MRSDETETTFKYSDAQWAEILSALAIFSVTKQDIKELHLRLIWTINIQVYGDPEFRQGSTELVRHDKEMTSTIRRLFLLANRQGREGAALRKAAPYLRSIHRLRIRRIRQTVELQQKIAGLRLQNGRRDRNRFQRRLTGQVAAAWEGFGGAVNHGLEYRKFFEAAVKPVLIDPEIKRKHSCAWSSGMFKAHVTEHMRIRGTPGRRGRRRELST